MSRTIPPRGFEHAEFEARLAGAQKNMAQHGFDGILVMSEPEVRYFSGFHTLFWQSPARPWFLFLPRAGNPVAVIPEIGAPLMRQTWIDDIRCWNAPAPHDDGISLLTELLTPYSAQGKRVGLMKGPETTTRMPLNDLERLLDALPELQIGDATDVVRALRMVKSSAEIAKIGHVCAIASDAFAVAPKLFHQGQSLIETFRAFRMECLAQGADDVPYLAGGAGQGGYSDIIAPPSSRPLQSGDILMLDTGAMFDGYFCDFDRNFALGQADDHSKYAYDVLYRATEAGLAIARPGTSCRDLFFAMQQVIAELDPTGGKVGRLGHGLGMQLTEWPSHAAFDQTVLQENMVITLEPSLSYGAGRIMVHEENIVVQDGAPRLLSTRAPATLPILN